MANPYDTTSAGIRTGLAAFQTIAAQQDQAADRQMRQEQMERQNLRESVRDRYTAEDRAAAAEERGLARQDRVRRQTLEDENQAYLRKQRADELVRRRLGGALTAFDTAAARGKPLDYTQWVSPKVRNWTGAVRNTMGQIKDAPPDATPEQMAEIDAQNLRAVNSPELIQALNDRQADAIGRGTGDTIDSDIDLGEGQVVPKGYVRTGNRAVGLVPSREGNGFYMVLEASAQDPSDPSKTINWRSLRTTDAKPGSAPKEIRIEDILDGTATDDILSAIAAESKDQQDFRDRALALYVEHGGQPGDIKVVDRELEGRAAKAKVEKDEADIGESKARADYYRRGGAGGGGTAKTPGGVKWQYIQQVADEKFNGDTDAALEYVGAGNISDRAADYAKRALEEQRTNRIKPGKEGYRDYWSFYEEGKRRFTPQAKIRAPGGAPIAPNGVKPGAGAKQPAATQAPPPNAAKLIEDANAAIGRGADPDKVRARLQQLGVQVQ